MTTQEVGKRLERDPSMIAGCTETMMKGIGIWSESEKWRRSTHSV